MEDITRTLKNKEGIFGMGFSFNEHLDLLNLVVLAIFGIIIKLFFQENYSKLGNVGPASTTIWGYGLTALSLFFMIFMSMYKTEKKIETPHVLENIEDYGILKYLSSILINNTLPIVLTFGVVIYIIILNFMYYTRINANLVSDSYHIYSFFTSLLIIMQLGLIIKFMYNKLEKQEPPEQNIVRNASYIVAVINFIFVLINHILLAFYSTDG